MLGTVVAAASSAPGDFFTGQSLGTFAGASLATTVVGNTLRRVTHKDLVVIPFVVAVVFALVAAEATGHPHTLGDFLLVFVNGCLLFCTALGVNDTLVSVVEPREEEENRLHGGRKVSWLQPWLVHR